MRMCLLYYNEILVQKIWKIRNLLDIYIHFFFFLKNISK